MPPGRAEHPKAQDHPQTQRAENHTPTPKSSQATLPRWQDCVDHPNLAFQAAGPGRPLKPTASKRREEPSIRPGGRNLQLNPARTSRAMSGVRRPLPVDVHPRVNIAASELNSHKSPLRRRFSQRHIRRADRTEAVGDAGFRPVGNTTDVKIFAGHGIAPQKRGTSLKTEAINYRDSARSRSSRVSIGEICLHCCRDETRLDVWMVWCSECYLLASQ